MKKSLPLSILAFMIGTALFAQVGFQPHTIIEQGSTNGPKAAFTADLDNDGNLDVVSVSEFDRKIAWYRNDGNGNLGPQQIISLNEFAPSMGLAADIDNDGNMDIVVTSAADDKVVWYKNIGAGRFAPPSLISATVPEALNVIAGDIDNDGDLDIVVFSFTDDQLSWFENLNGQGLFGSKIIISDNSGARILAFADIDSDGDLDIVSTSNFYSGLEWFENLNGMGGFGSAQVIDSDISSVSKIYPFDVDQDGKLDILANKGSDGGIVYYRNINGQGTFAPANQFISDNIGDFVLNDIDHDGDMDIVAQIRFDELVWYENLNGLTAFGPKQHIGTTFWVINLTMADIDNNGEFDIIFSDEREDKVAWYSSNGQGDFGSEIVLSEIQPIRGIYDIQIADLDGDGFLDIVSANFDANNIAWLKGIDGQGNFGDPTIISENISFAYSISLADIDGDGDIDIVSSSDQNNQVTWLKNIDGLGTFEMQQSLTTNANEFYAVYTSDLDDDGDMDILSTGYGSGLVWYENINGQGSFALAQTVEADISYSENIFTPDLDGDGDKDIITADYFDDYFAWYENLDGQGTFSSRITLEENVQGSFYLYPSDLDSDGDLDLIGSVINEDLLIWFENLDGNGTFSSRQVLAENVPAAERIIAFDADGDGDQDIVISDYVESTYSWFENSDGQGTLGPRQVLDSNSRGALAIAVADIDNNGTLDIVTGTFKRDNIKWYENFGRLGNTINGTVTLDLDNNGCTGSDAPLRQIMVVADNGTHSFATFTQPNGEYQLYTNTGTFITSLNSELPTYFNSNPAFHTIPFVGQNNTYTADFCVAPSDNINDLNVSLYPLSDARPGFQAHYQLVFNNVGTNVLDGTVTVNFDEVRLDFLDASEPIGSQTNGAVSFNYSNLQPFETRNINLNFQVATPPTTEINDILEFTATIEPLTSDETPGDNTFTLFQTVIGSLDPNDILVLEGDRILIDDTDKYLHYIIRFQNTGTASAINVNVKNELDSNLDWNTLQIEGISHNNRVEITDGNQIAFIFDNINLPDATTNEPESHGYIQYKIKPKTTIQVGDVMMNNAAIYFDFNPPVITNTVLTTVVDRLGTPENSLDSVVLYPVPTNNVLNIKSKTPIVDAKVFNNLGQLLFKTQNPKGIEQINIEQLSTGMYILKLTDLNQNITSKKFMKQE